MKLFRRKERPCLVPEKTLLDAATARSVGAKAAEDLKAFAKGLLPSTQTHPLVRPASAPEGTAIPPNPDTVISSVGSSMRRVSGGRIKAFIRDLEKSGFDVLEDGPMSVDALISEDPSVPQRVVLTIPVMLVPIEAGN